MAVLLLPKHSNVFAIAAALHHRTDTYSALADNHSNNNDDGDKHREFLNSRGIMEACSRDISLTENRNLGAESGKTIIANFLSEANENPNTDYKPTQGVRILEFEAKNLNVNNRNVKAEVELWDASGDHKFESCWPAFRDANGIIFVYNPSSPEHARELELLYNYFVTQTGMSSRNCVVFANQKQAADKDLKYGSKLSNTFSRVMHVAVNVEESGNRLQADFSSFLETVISGLRDRSEQEELNIINNQSF